MKRMIWLILITLTAVIFLVGCRKKTEADTENIEGGVRSDTSYDAPKEIESTEINYFYCEFSNYAMVNEDTFLKNRNYQLKAFIEDGIVQGSYKIYGGGESEEETFTAEANFLDNLQKIVKEHNLVENNGLSYRVSGLPEMYGAVLEVEYESGERIYASHNQDNFLSVAAMEALDILFRKQFEEVTDEKTIPKTLDLTVSEQFSMEHINGRYVTIECSVLELGYEAPDGIWLNTDGYPALEEALSAYNEEEWDFHAGSRSVLRNAAENLEGDSEEYRELYTCTDAYVTRNDTKVLSFYTFTRHYEGWIPELYDWEARNFEVESGKLLTFEDVFTDLNQLAECAAAEIQAVYPEQQFLDDMEGLIKTGISENEEMLFALSYDCVHIFAKNQYLSNEYTKGQHIVLNYSDYPELVKEEYRTSAENWMIKLDFEMEHPLIEELQSQLDWEYAPDAYLMCMEGQSYIYVKVPAGDITQRTDIYAVTEAGIEYLGEIDGAMHDEANYNPKCMKMYQNIDFEELEVGENIPYEVYAVREDGYPIPIQDVIH